MRRVTLVVLCCIAPLFVAGVAASPAAAAGKLTKCEFTLETAPKPTFAFCERTITSGVRIEATTASKIYLCTAGPLLVEKDETYLLTAGHCGAPATWESQELKAAAVAAPIGTAVNAVNSPTEGDFEEIKIPEQENMKTAWAEPFGGPDFDPVWPDIVEWGQGHSGRAPQSAFVAGEVKDPKENEEVCVEGFMSGEHCGTIFELKSSCGAAYIEMKVSGATMEGDSGGPVFHVNRENGELSIEGVFKGTCGGTPIFTPIRTILKKYDKQKLLTTKTEKRKEPKKEKK